MATFGLDALLIAKFKNGLDVDLVRVDQGTDFFYYRSLMLYTDTVEIH